MKKYIKPAAEAMEVETQHLLADSMDFNPTNPAKHNTDENVYGDGYSDGLVKEERNFWE